jgi:hypothetical protein
MLSIQAASIPIRRPPVILIESVTQGIELENSKQSANLNIEPNPPPRPTSKTNLVLTPIKDN